MKSVKRLNEIDFIKGLLVILMVIYHSLNYHGYSPYAYMKFLPPSFIMLTGFIITQLLFPRYLGDTTRAQQRLATRSVKIILIFTSLNIIGHILWTTHEYGFFYGLKDFWGNWREIFIVGRPDLVSFDILLPISYTIIISLILLTLHLTGPLSTTVLSVSFFSVCLLMEFRGTGIYNVSMISAGAIGMALGFIPLSIVDNFSKSWGKYVPLTICLAIVYFSGHNYFTQMFSTILALLILYLISLKVNLSHIINKQIVFLGQYSLVGYILQIVFLKFYCSFLPVWQTGKNNIALTVLLTITITYLSILIIDYARSRIRYVDILYKTVFA